MVNRPFSPSEVQRAHRLLQDVADADMESDRDSDVVRPLRKFLFSRFICCPMAISYADLTTDSLEALFIGCALGRFLLGT